MTTHTKHLVRTIIRLAAITAAGIAVMLWITSPEAEAHTVTPRTCNAVASLYPTPAQRRQVARTCVKLAKRHKFAHDYIACKKISGSIARNKCIIRLVFGAWGGEAVTVAGCESTWRTDAENGQYLGLFQMGSSERARYGHGPTALQQSRSAFSYFAASGYDWSPWDCKP